MDREIRLKKHIEEIIAQGIISGDEVNEISPKILKLFKKWRSDESLIVCPDCQEVSCDCRRKMKYGFD